MKRLVLACAAALILSVSATGKAADAPPTSPGPTAPNPFTRPTEKRGNGNVLTYFRDRFRDLFDIVTIKLGWGTEKSIGFQLRLCRPIQIGAGIFEGGVLAMDRGCFGVMKEVNIEGGVSFFYPGYIARKVIWQDDEAKKRNLFFGDVGKNKKELTLEDVKMYYDENQTWINSTVQAQLPYLPRVEVTINWGEVPDFVISFLGISGFRVPPAFHKQDGPGTGSDVERIPAPSIFWHGQEEYETYE